MVTHTIKVLGRELQVKSDATPEEVAEVEALVNSTLDEAGIALSGADTQLVVILAMMNLAEACLKARNQVEEQQRTLHSRIQTLLSRIEVAAP
ncbi:cell division protein ZapA [Geomesophilobacter sediminis]|uniref:Cell division protein ZapA n=1 Tax=Geomesophilobacter sediminis TaxID=2798584 RepID=A0A8J7J023_9BACT|nr:cell division protein ZapA [Geomesophilobacter sediminis]MBJ6725822.1 cell division protein ZapA [Geomesophilobacter sediminis]